jgi:hypothetical protein
MSVSESAKFQQRGIEGVISIDANLPAQMTVPVTSVDLNYKMPDAPVSDQVEVWLPDLGNTAAETIMRQIENEGSSQHLHIQAMPPGSVDLQSMDRGFSAAESA